MSDGKGHAVERVARKTGDRLRLRGHVTVAHAKALRDAALASLEAGRKITVDATEATSLDAASAQVLLALQLSCRSRGTVLAWQGLSDDARSTLAKFGLEAALQPVEPAR